MTFSVGATLPDATLLTLDEDGAPTSVQLADKLNGRKVVLFGLPGAFTRTCTAAHVPSFIRTKPKFDEKGVDEIICVAVNDPHVMGAWAKATGAAEAGITMLADASGEFTRAIGMAFDAPAAGFYGRCKRFSLYAEDGVIKVLNVEEGLGCEISAGETMLEAI